MQCSAEEERREEEKAKQASLVSCFSAVLWQAGRGRGSHSEETGCPHG